MEKVKIKIKRFDGKVEKIETYEIPYDERTTIIEALMYIQSEIDPTIGFRVQCRAAICGTCGLLVNQEYKLGCRTKIVDIVKDKEIFLEPMKNLKVIKDLVVDHSEFLQKLKNVKAWFVPKEPFEKVFPEDLKKFEKETDCILCGLCYSICPVFETDEPFGGPINYVKTYRFWKDKNDALGDERIVLARENHITSCVHCKYCSMTCPKEIPVEQDIFQIEFYGKQKGIIEKEENQFDFGDFGSF
ncbi:MAG: succinate dehydrogenase/fumarate reductase iron-sulfur subunit [Aquificae bacterium]|nr:succinate dehydrogenase/fumarate reductase iron-sulfur subunit [Aquificota bacterium]